MTNIELYEVGGCVRDSIIGKPCKDIDIVVIAPSYSEMKKYIVNELGGEIFLETEKYLTLRARLKRYDNKVIDFVLARKDSTYRDGRHPNSVTPGSLYDDLQRRDFSCNSIAKNFFTGEIIDPFNGRSDIEDKIIRTVGNPGDRFSEDSLRILRALRFSITLGFEIHDLILSDIYVNANKYCKLLLSVSLERVQSELHKAMSINTKRTLDLLYSLPEIYMDTIFRDNRIWFKPILINK